MVGLLELQRTGEGRGLVIRPLPSNKGFYMGKMVEAGGVEPPS